MRSGRIAVLVRQFPKLSETFIFGEISNLIAAGLNIEIISLQRPTDGLQHADADQFASRTTYLDDETGDGSILTLAQCLAGSLSKIPEIVRQLRGHDVTLGQLCALIRVCERLDISHIHAHYISEPALLADLVNQTRGLSFSVSAHAKDIYLSSAETLRKRISNAAFVTTCTAYNHKYLASHAGEAAKKVHLLYHGIDSERFRPAVSRNEQESPLIVAVGRFKRKKGFDLLISACAALRADGVPLRCEIIGYGSEQAALQALIKSHSLEDKVSLRAPVTHDELTGILQSAAVCVLPCRQTEDGDRDGIPNSLLEAMSCEIPVVTTSVSGIPEVIQSEKNGLLVEPENPVALANAIQRVLDDATLRQTISAAGRHTVTEMFCWSTNISTLFHMLCTTVPETGLGESA